jgi:arsenite/tail-anchored protein-transporting ATPase
MLRSRLDALWGKRIILITGKGGVGRTVFVAAAAATAAARGRKVLVADMEDPSSDRRSALARLYGYSRLPRDPVKVQPGIDAALVQTEYGTELFLRSVFKARSLVSLAMRSQSLQRMLYAAPSFREMGMFFHLLHLTELRNSDGSFCYDNIIADLPATGHTLAMTSLPDILLRLIPSGPVADALRRGQRHYNNPNVTTTWVVTLPEQLPVTETIELIEGLHQSKVPVSGVIVNRMPANPFTPGERIALTKALQDRTVRGLRNLRRIDQAASALDRLNQHLSLPTIVLNEFNADGAELATLLASELARVT